MSFNKLNTFWRLQIVGWIVYMFFIYITFLSVARPENFVNLMYIKGFRALVGFLLTSVLWIIYRRIVRRFSISSIVISVIFLSITFGCLWTGIEQIYVWQTSEGYDFYARWPRFPRIALDYAVTTMAWSAIYFGIKYWQQWQMERENALQARILAEKAQLEMLRYQLNPHFLFNALNSIRASVDEDKFRAKEMITQLSEFLRHSLLSGEAKEVRLSEELEAVKNYLAIEKIRFEEKLEVEFDIEESAKDSMVPCFLLNPLVENAIKHGLQTSPKPLRVKISAKLKNNKLLLEVTNTGKIVRNSNSNGTKIGLKNVRERLDKLFPGKSSFELFEKDNFVIAQIEIQK
jgi:sensor histidine kinase YesM